MSAGKTLRLSHVALVGAGGVVGTAAREALTLVFPSGAGIPFTIFAINVTGAFLLGLLVSGLGARADKHYGGAVRSLLGAGVLGGFTTYSALALDTAQLGAAQLGGSPALGIAYAVGSVVAGIAAAGAGLWLGGIHSRRPNA